MRPEAHGLLLMLLLGTAACNGGGRLAGVSDSTFVATMAELRRVEQQADLDSAQRDSARGVTLQRRGLTPEELEAAAEALAADPERAMELWRAIDEKARDTPAPVD